jgi:hypothetical protein
VIDISKIYKKLKDSELEFFQDGGPYDPYTDVPEGALESQYLGEDTLSIPFPIPSQRDIDYALNYDGNSGLTPIDQSTTPGVMVPNIDISQNNTSSVFRRVDTSPEELGTLADELKAKLGISVPTNNSMIPSSGTGTSSVAPSPSLDSQNYDALSFGEAFRQARSKVGSSGTFEYKGKRYTTAAASDNKPSTGATTPRASTGSRGSSTNGLSGEQIDYNNLVNILSNNPSIEALRNYSPQMLRTALGNNEGSGEAQTLLRQALGSPSSSSGAEKIPQELINKLSDIGLPKKRAATQQPASTNTEKITEGYDPKTDTFTVNGNSYTRARLNAVNAQLEKSIEGGESKHGFAKIYKTQQIINRNKKLIDNAQNFKNEQKVNDMKYDSASGSIIFNGKRFNVNNKSEQDKLTSMLSDLPLFGRGNYGSAYDKYNKIKNSINKVQKKELGGEIEEFAIGGPLPVPNFPQFPNLSSVVDPTTGQVATTSPMQPTPQFALTPEMDARIQASGQNQFQSFIGDNGQMRIQTDADKGLNILTAQSDLDRYYIDPKTNQLSPITIKQGQNYDGGLDALYDTTLKQGGPNGNSTSNPALSMLGMLQNQQSYDVPEDLRMLGQSLAFNANKNAKYTNDIDRGIATGLNVTRGVAAGLDALVGGARELYSGYAGQQRQQNVEDNFYRRQRRALENQQIRYANGGEVVQHLLSMFAEGGQNPNDLSAAFGEQDKRPDLSEEELLTGEYIQQALPQAGVRPNAELENKEFVQHNDGEVQEVVGRTHSQGGERLALDPGTTVISDKVKLGAKNAKTINKEFDLGVKAGDTYASVVAKYTKKIGLSKLNDEQEGYFTQLQKVSETALADKYGKNSETSELNNSFLSQKINDLEQQKAFVEDSRSQFTEFIYNLQEGSKPKREEDAEVMAKGGEISHHALGDQVPGGPDEPMTLDQLIALNNTIGTNSKDPSIGGNLWDALYYQPMNKWQQNLGLDPTNRSTHLDYQKDVVNLLNPQLKKLIENGEMGLTNKHRALLKEAGIKDAGSKTSFKQLTDADKKKISNIDDFVTQGYEDGLAGHRGVTVLPGDLDEEAYNKLTGAYDKLTDADGRKIYAKYNEDGTIQKTKDGKVVFYYPQTGQKVPETKTPATNTPQPFVAPKRTPYQAPFLPSQRPVAPTPASPVPVYQTRLDRLDPVRLGYDQQVSEINRQASAVASQFDGLTDSQRASALTNLSANTQKNVADVVNNVAVQNAMNQFQVQGANLQQSNAEEQARLNNARYSDELWMKTEANQEADNRDYQEALQRIQLGRFRYLTKDRQIHDMIENFKVGPDGGLDFDQGSAVPLTTTATGDTVMQDMYGRTKVVKTTKTDKNGNVVGGTTTVTKKP